MQTICEKLTSTDENKSKTVPKNKMKVLEADVLVRVTL